jgi:hypothetical protein
MEVVERTHGFKFNECYVGALALLLSIKLVMVYHVLV